MMDVDSNSRLSLSAVFAHPWVQGLVRYIRYNLKARVLRYFDMAIVIWMSPKPLTIWILLRSPRWRRFWRCRRKMKILLRWHYLMVMRILFRVSKRSGDISIGVFTGVVR